jgi:hypothetical protein
MGRNPDAPAYELADDCYAVHGVAGSPVAKKAILVLEDGSVAVFRGQPPASATAGAGARAQPPRIGPVYASAPGGGLAVPTGRILVRFSPGTLAEERRADLRGAGFEIEKVLAYAPEAAWVRATSGGIGAALLGLPEIGALPGVEHVEPQMLMKSVRRKR